MSRAVFLTAVVAIAIVAILGGGLASTASGGVGAVARAPAHAAATASDVTPAGTSLLKQAVASINAATPRSGSPVTCSVTSATAATCGGSIPPTLSGPHVGAHANPVVAPASTVRAASSSAPTVPSHSSVPTSPDPTWYNVTTQLTTASGGVIPAVGQGSGIAFDPLLGEVVLFAGTTVTADGPFVNETWTYNGVTWTDLTSTLTTAPSVRWYSGFDYDPTFGGVILVGGWQADGLGLNDTWLFTGTWTNISTTVGLLLTDTGAYLDYGGIGGSAGAWDPALDGFVLTDGCSDSACSLDAWSLTWLLTATGWQTIDYGPGFGSLTWLGTTHMAYDPVDGYLVLFGGYDYDSGYDQNYTYTYAGGADYGNNWVNISANDAVCSPGCTPVGRDDPSITWDAQLGAVFMTGGFNNSLDSVYNDTWTFLGGHWHTLTPGAPDAFGPMIGGALAVNSTDIGVFIVGGFYAGAPGPDYGSQNEWVFETPPQATLTETPHPIDLGTAVTFTAGWVAGTGTGWYAGWNLSYGNGHSSVVRAGAGQNSSTAYTKAFPYTYGSAGTFTANATWSDFFYVSSAKSTVSLTVNPALVATITASATTITAGGAVTFTTNPTGGSGTYTYAWSFGDSTTSTAQGPPAHTFAKAGTYTVNLTVTDSLGVAVKRNVTIAVNAKPSNGLNLGNTGTYLIIGVVVVVLAILTALLLMRRRKKPATAQPWQAGAPPAGAPPSGAMGEAPPGVGESPPPPPPS
ncbi:MAG: PKD domain-containing protein [Thermoplasmata archaeon]